MRIFESPPPPLPPPPGDIVQFVRDFTVHLDGVGDACSLACFDLARHGNSKYGAPRGQQQPDKACRSRQGKLEKSLLTFLVGGRVGGLRGHCV